MTATATMRNGKLNMFAIGTRVSTTIEFNCPTTGFHVPAGSIGQVTGIDKAFVYVKFEEHIREDSMCMIPNELQEIA